MQTPFKYLVMILFYSPTSWGSNVLKSDICNAENKDVLCSLFAVIVLLHCICWNVLVQLKHIHNLLAVGLKGELLFLNQLLLY